MTESFYRTHPNTVTIICFTFPISIRNGIWFVVCFAQPELILTFSHFLHCLKAVPYRPENDTNRFKTFGNVSLRFSRICVFFFPFQVSMRSRLSFCSSVDSHLQTENTQTHTKSSSTCYESNHREYLWRKQLRQKRNKMQQNVPPHSRSPEMKLPSNFHLHESVNLD